MLVKPVIMEILLDALRTVLLIQDMDARQQLACHQCAQRPAATE